jgi:hypothetical protein
MFLVLVKETYNFEVATLVRTVSRSLKGTAKVKERSVDGFDLDVYGLVVVEVFGKVVRWCSQDDMNSGDRSYGLVHWLIDGTLAVRWSWEKPA